MHSIKFYVFFNFEQDLRALLFDTSIIILFSE